MGLVKHLTVDELARIVYGDIALGRGLRAIALIENAVHDAVEHGFHTGALGILLQKLLIPDLVLIVGRWHSVVFYMTNVRIIRQIWKRRERYATVIY